MFSLCKVTARGYKLNLRNGTALVFLKCNCLGDNGQFSRNFSISNPRPTTRGTIRVVSKESNLQQTKHVKVSEEFIRKQVERFKLSKRRLANMMGEDPNFYTERDVDRAIKYLFPSDLDEDCRPKLANPRKIFTSTVKKQCDESGRPFHYLFYTQKQNFYELLHQIYQRVINLRKSAEGQSSEVKELNLSGTRWMTHEELVNEVLDGENIQDYHYRQFLAQIEQLMKEPLAYKEEKFIMTLRKEIPVVSMLGDIKDIEVSECGRSCVEEEGRKKTAIANVKLLSPGTGKITVNGKPFFRYFPHLEDRQTVISPFSFLGCLMKYDVEATVYGATWTAWNAIERSRPVNFLFRKASQACAIRAGISRAIRSFITEEEVELLRRAGLLTNDIRMKERKLPGQWKARKKFTWKRR